MILTFSCKKFQKVHAANPLGSERRGVDAETPTEGDNLNKGKVQELAYDFIFYYIMPCLHTVMVSKESGNI